MNGVITMASSSVSSLFGNVGCGIRELILSKFPPHYFKYTNVSTELAFRNFSRVLGRNSLNEIRKRVKPYIVIQPVYQVPEQDSFLQGINLTKNIDDLEYGISGRELFTVLKDDKYDYNLKFKLNRDKIEYEVKIAVESLHQQLDLYKALQNHIVWERSYFHPMALESVIPKNVIYYISHLCRMDVDENPEMIPVFLKHLNAVSAGYPITYKMRNASATDEYFMYYMHNVVVTFYDFNLDSVEKRNMVDDHYELSFRVSAEFNLPGLYIIDGNVDHAFKIKSWIESKPSMNITSDADTDYIPLFTYSNLWNRYPREKNGMQLYGTTIFTTDNKNSKYHYDNIDIGSVFDLDHTRVINYYASYNSLDTIMQVYVLKNQHELEQGTEFYFDWSAMDVVIINPDNKATYRLIIYIDSARFNEILRDKIEDIYISDKTRLKENKIDWMHMFDSYKIPTFLLDKDCFDSHDDFYIKIDDEDQDVHISNVHDKEFIDIEEANKKPFGMESIFILSVWEYIFGVDRAKFLLKTQKFDEYSYGYYMYDDNNEKCYITNFITYDPEEKSDYYVQIMFSWKNILGDNCFELYGTDINDDNKYESFMIVDGKRYSITNFVDSYKTSRPSDDIIRI